MSPKPKTPEKEPDVQDAADGLANVTTEDKPEEEVATRRPRSQKKDIPDEQVNALLSKLS